MVQEIRIILSSIMHWTSIKNFLKTTLRTVYCYQKLYETHLFTYSNFIKVLSVQRQNIYNKNENQHKLLSINFLLRRRKWICAKFVSKMRYKIILFFYLLNNLWCVDSWSFTIFIIQKHKFVRESCRNYKKWFSNEMDLSKEKWQADNWKSSFLVCLTNK